MCLFLQAVGLNKKEVAEFLLSKVRHSPDNQIFLYPTLIKVGSTALSCADYLGRTPLHYAALVADADHSLYNWLVEQGADTTATDKVGREMSWIGVQAGVCRRAGLLKSALKSQE